MLHAVGIGLDWLYDALAPAERAAVVAAAVRLGLDNVRAALSSAPPPWADAFIGTPSNWNAVVLGGAVVAALAVAGEPGASAWVAEQLLPAALADMSPSLSDLGPGSGANREGCVAAAAVSATPRRPTITSTALRSRSHPHPHLCDAAQAQLPRLPRPRRPRTRLLRHLTATGADGGLLTPGAAHAASFILYATAPTHPVHSFHYWADSRSMPECVSQYLALARHYGDGAAAFGFRALTLRAPDDPRTAATTAMNAPVALLYFTAAGDAADLARLPLARPFPETHSATSRSSWADPNATIIAWKGSNVSWAWAHSHFDGGSFVYAAEGQWWAQELGSDDYAAPDYFGPGRFRLYRTNASGHNALSLQLTRGRGIANPRCIPALAEYVSNCTEVRQELFLDGGASGAWDTAAVLNSRDAYAALLAPGGRLARGLVVLRARAALLVVDEVERAAAADVAGLRWALHTVANVSLDADARGASLTTFSTSAVIRVSLLQSSTCAGAAFAAAPLRLAPPALPTPGVTLLTLAAAPAGCTRIVVAVGRAADVAAVALADPRPLRAWGDGGGPLQLAGGAGPGARRRGAGGR